MTEYLLNLEGLTPHITALGERWTYSDISEIMRRYFQGNEADKNKYETGIELISDKHLDHAVPTVNLNTLNDILQKDSKSPKGEIQIGIDERHKMTRYAKDNLVYIDSTNPLVMLVEYEDLIDKDGKEIIVAKQPLLLPIQIYDTRDLEAVPLIIYLEKYEYGIGISRFGDSLKHNVVYRKLSDKAHDYESNYFKNPEYYREKVRQFLKNSETGYDERL